MTTILPFISTMLIVLSAILIAIGWWLIKQKKREQHEKVMIAAALSALLFFIIYSLRTVFIGNVAFAGPDNLKLLYTIFLIFHIILATVGGVFGIITLVYGFRKQFAKHKKIGPITSIIWFFTAITGVAVYLLLYVIYPSEEVTSLIKAILGN